MSIIQRIRDKAAWFIFIIIGIALLGFLVQDAFVGKTGRGLFGGNTTTVGSVNGKKIEATEYEQRIKQMEDQYQSMGYPMNDMMRQNVRENTWGQLIAENTISEEVEKLGLGVSSRELDDILFGPDAPEDFRRQFTNEQGVYDVNAAKNAIASIRKQKSTIADNFNNVYLPALLTSRLREKYVALISRSTYYPKWMIEKMNSDNNAMAAVSYVNAPYLTVPDSSIKITDEDINAYVTKHKDDFKQEESRSISYVSFDASPSASDTAQLRNNLELLKKDFAAASESEVNSFLAKNGSAVSFLDAYISKTQIQVPSKDSIMALPKGAVFGPYLDASNLNLAKMLDEKVLPDSVKARHILIATVNSNGQMVMPDSLAAKKIDSVKLAIDKGASFDSMAAKFSDDGGSKTKGGDLGYFTSGRMVKEFNDFCFEGKKGDRKVVKTQYGYHLIEIEDQKNFNPAYKIAYLSKPITASQETDEKASGLASQFASESRNAKAFDDNAAKRGYNKMIGTDIKPNDLMINGLGGSRQMVKWIFDAGRGDVSEMFTVDSKYVVAIVTEINKEGTMNAAKARPLAEFIIRNEKKADILKKKIGSANTLEAVSAAVNQPVQKADSISYASPNFPNAGMEGKVGGYVFNPDAKSKLSAPLAGNGGVYVVHTENVYARSNTGAGVEQQRAAMVQNQQSALQRGVLESILRKAADVKDTRSKIF